MDLGSGDHADSLTLFAGVPVSTPEPTTWSLIADSITLSSVDQGSNVGNRDIDTLDQFAQLTGVKVYATDIQKAVTEVMAGSRSGYSIEYNAPRLDGKYHKIRVTCSRKGVRLQVKQGYYAN